jgi:hypothetical protein
VPKLILRITTNSFMLTAPFTNNALFAVTPAERELGAY